MAHKSNAIEMYLINTSEVNYYILLDTVAVVAFCDWHQPPNVAQCYNPSATQSIIVLHRIPR